ncbi:hypothetical protein PUNSTDRAFT_38421, partial [Punctularia strigosozonata HHB-11173 SS5]
ITYPNSTQPWVNGQTNHVSWVKGLLDGVHGFDIELARLSTDSLIFLASNVPTNKNFGLNVFLQDVPAADDYFLVFLNSTHGVTYVVSDRFTILDASSSSSALSPLTTAATITISGGPNPTAQFVTTFPASAASRVELGARW